MGNSLVATNTDSSTATTEDPGVFRPAEPKQKPELPISLSQKPRPVGFEVKLKAANDNLFALEHNAFEKVLIEALIKKNFAPELIIRVLEIFRENDEKLRALKQEEQSPTKEAVSSPVTSSAQVPPSITSTSIEHEVSKAIGNVSPLRVLRSSQGGRAYLPSRKETTTAPAQVISLEEKRRTLDDIRRGRVETKPVETVLQEPVVIETPPSQDVVRKPEDKTALQEKMKSISPLWSALEVSREEDSRAWGGPLATSVPSPHAPVTQEKAQVPAWRTSPLFLQSEELVATLSHLESLSNEDDFFKLHAPYAQENPALLEALKRFNVNEVLHSPTFPQLSTTSAREEVSHLINDLIAIHVSIDPSFTCGDTLTISDLYTRTRTAIVQADKENRVY